MGRHGSHRPAEVRLGRVRVPIRWLALAVAVLALAGLGAWWFSVRTVTDPIDADPVSATAVVVESASCDGSGQTVVRLPGVAGGEHSVLDGCGFTVGQQVPVDYLAGDPAAVRLAGTSRAGDRSVLGALVPIGIVVAGLVVASLLIAAGRSVGNRGRRRGLSVAELAERLAARRDGDDGATPSPGHVGPAG